MATNEPQLNQSTLLWLQACVKRECQPTWLLQVVTHEGTFPRDVTLCQFTLQVDLSHASSLEKWHGGEYIIALGRFAWQGASASSLYGELVNSRHKSLQFLMVCKRDKLSVDEAGLASFTFVVGMVWPRSLIFIAHLKYFLRFWFHNLISTYIDVVVARITGRSYYVILSLDAINVFVHHSKKLIWQPKALCIDYIEAGCKDWLAWHGKQAAKT